MCDHGNSSACFATRSQHREHLQGVQGGKDVVQRYSAFRWQVPLEVQPTRHSLFPGNEQEWKWDLCEEAIDDGASYDPMRPEAVSVVATDLGPGQLRRWTAKNEDIPGWIWKIPSQLHHSWR